MPTLRFRYLLCFCMLTALLSACDTAVITPDGGSTIDLPIYFTEAPEGTTLLRYAQFEFASPGATAYECALNDSDFVACASPLFLASTQKETINFKSAPSTNTVLASRERFRGKWMM
ncbi:MAG: hypothetical protein RhofKO_20770 [Rhodothermales bacterium]